MDPRVKYLKTLDQKRPNMLSGNTSDPKRKPAGWGTRLPGQQEIVSDAAKVRNAGHGQKAHRK